MIEIDIFFILSTFVAGLLMFLAPCTLPLVPAYLAFISGVKQDDLKGDDNKRKHAQRLIIKNGLAFILGFSVIFILFGVLAGLLGAQLGQFRVLLSQVGGVFIIIFGLMMLGVINIAPLMREHKFQVPSVFTPGKPISAFFIGSTFALGWTPCVGPVLASVLLLASTSTTALEGGLLLAVFSLGLAVPFLLTAVVYARATKTIERVSGITKWISYIGGVFLIFLGILLLSGNFEATVIYGYRVFEYIGIDAIFDHL